MSDVLHKLTCSGDLFRSWICEESGVGRYLLRSGGGGGQQSLYFTKPCCDDGFNYLWFAWSRANGGHAWGGRMLGLVDLVQGEMRLLAELAFTDGSLAVLPETGDILWCNTSSVFRREPLLRCRPQRLGGLPVEMTRNRFVRRVATQLSVSGDGRKVFLDSQIGQRVVMATLDMETGGYEPHFSSAHVFNHAQFSPCEPDLVLLARDDDTDFTTGQSTPYDHRMFLYRLGGELTPIGPSGRSFGHEVWSADGKYIWFLDFRAGVMRLTVSSGEVELIWPGVGWHAQASRCGRYLVADHRINRGTGYSVRFVNCMTGKEVEIARMLVPTEDLLHTHPHPRFGARDSVITYTTTVRGRADLAVVPVASLLAATG
ncbi:hypothetical protein J8J14_20855 [Roseomonas sp. SSH11]|uniref:Oligogalacturonide lyase n=1 Tax=Pararoseomonas baculiformis TaxID=2820812 RepID=A0ABS4AJN2_9PROT|nr:hypothetical protein [Pararoseomonas baculiformis]MBP0447228.1 hypothetical protein [Pararoseomonas baculiformis]